MISIIYTFYNPTKPPFQQIIKKHLDVYKNYPLELRKQIQFVLIDDCAPMPVNPKFDFPINVKIARIQQDIFWNNCGASNLGFRIADGEWIFRCDMDNFLSNSEMEKLINRKKEKGKYYIGSRRMPNGRLKYKEFMNIFLINKDDFWKTGGYDEDFATGGRGYCDWMLHSLLEHQNIKKIKTDIITDQMERYCIDIPDSKRRNVNSNHNLLIVKKEQLKGNTYKHTKIHRYDWNIILERKI